MLCVGVSSGSASAELEWSFGTSDKRPKREVLLDASIRFECKSESSTDPSSTSIDTGACFRIALKPSSSDFAGLRATAGDFRNAARVGSINSAGRSVQGRNLHAGHCQAAFDVG